MEISSADRRFLLRDGRPAGGTPDAPDNLVQPLLERIHFLRGRLLVPKALFGPVGDPVEAAHFGNELVDVLSQLEKGAALETLLHESVEVLHHPEFAHSVSLVLVFWGIVLASEQILPRVGYARTEETWLCTGAAGRWFPSEEIVDEPSTPDAAPTTPSAQLEEPAAEPAVPPLPESEVVP